MKILMSTITVFFLVSVCAYADIRVVSTKGEAAFLEGRNWRTMQSGQTLREGTTVSTGVNSTAVIMIDRHELVLDPLTTIKLYRNRVDSGGSDTDIGLKHGGVRARVDRVDRLRTNFNISTPVATSSVRGTEKKVSYGAASGMRARVMSGEIRAHNRKGVNRSVKGRSRFNQGSDGSRPGSLLGDTKGNSLISILSDGATDDEKEGSEVFGDQLTDSLEDSSQFFGSDPMSRVGMYINWPGEMTVE